MTKAAALSADHLKWFGFFINTFARIELQMQIAAAGMMGTDLGTAIIAMHGSQYRQKRLAVKNLSRTLGINGKRIPELEALLDQVHKFSQLRNRIAHSTWTEGRRPGSAKPMVMTLSDDDEPGLLGHYHNERDWTPADLKAEAIKLEKLANDITDVLRSTGLEARVQAMIDKSKSSTSERPGKPSSK